MKLDKWLPPIGWPTTRHRGDKPNQVLARSPRPYTMNSNRRVFKGDETTKENIIRFVESHFLHYRVPPTLREIGNEVGVSSTSMVTKYLEVLVDENKLERVEKDSRNYVLPLDRMFILLLRNKNT